MMKKFKEAVADLFVGFGERGLVQCCFYTMYEPEIPEELKN